MPAPAAERIAQVDIWLRMAREGRDLRGYPIKPGPGLNEYVDRLLEVRHDIQTEMGTPVNTQQLPTITPTVDPSEREKAIVAWLMNATVYRDGEPMIENHKLVGNEVMSQKYAAIMEKHFVENGTAVDDLREWMLDYQRGALLVRSNPAFVPFIAQSLLDHLVSKDMAWVQR